MKILNNYQHSYYAEGFKFNEFRLRVSDEHELYVAEYGNPKGTPLIKLHGGPGSKSKAKHSTLFNPNKYRIILFDQRGCGMSTPQGLIEANTTRDLVEDIEKIRKYLEIDKWNVMGGSWGSCLALAYAQAYPENVRNMILAGIFTFRRKEVDWVYKHVYPIFPDIYEKFIELVPEKYKSNPVEFYKQAILDVPNPDVELVKRFSYLETNILKLYPDLENLSLDYDVSQEQINSIRVFLHYEKNMGFLEEGELLEVENINKIRDIPAVIIQGRYDMVCPFETAWELHKLWPEAEFEVIQDAGHHTGSEPGIVDAVVRWSDKFSD